MVFKPRQGGGGNTGLWPLRPAGILPAVSAAQFQRSRTPLGAQTFEVCVPAAWRSSSNLGIGSFQHGTVAPSPLFNRIDEPVTETPTGIANPAVIDLFGVDQKTGEVLLVMNESRPWDGGHEQLHEMQEKFNAYASFILDGEMTEAHPELVGRKARIELRCQHMPNEEARGLLRAIHDQLELQAIKVEVVVADPNCGGQCSCHPKR